MSIRTFNIAIEKVKQNGGHDIFFYTIPSGFNNNDELLEYFTMNGYQAEICNQNDGYGILHISWH